jgi:hypothetical protein
MRCPFARFGGRFASLGNVGEPRAMLWVATAKQDWNVKRLQSHRHSSKLLGQTNGVSWRFSPSELPTEEPDNKGFFDNVSHEHLLELLKRWIGEARQRRQAKRSQENQVA